MTTEVLFFLSVGAGFLPRADATFFTFLLPREWTPEVPRRRSVSYISPNYFSVLKKEKVEYTPAINILQYFVTRFKDNIAGVSCKSSPLTLSVPI